LIVPNLPNIFTMPLTMNTKIMLRPIISIIIPTKNRVDYIYSCATSLLSINSDEFEVVIHDNSDNDKTEIVLKELLVDPRIKYYKVRKALNMSENFTGGLIKSNGIYIMFIGDDDGVNPNILEIAKWAYKRNLEAVTSPVKAYYFWPDVYFKLYKNIFSSSLFIRHFSNTITYPDARKEVVKCLKHAGRGFLKLPKLYHGIVLRSSVEKIFDIAGTYFPGPTPDMASAVALGMVIKSYAHLDYPLVIAGTGRSSGGGAGTAKSHNWTLNNTPWFSKQSLERWSNIVPGYASGSTLWAEDVIQAVKAMKEEQLLKHFGAIDLYARCAAFDKISINEIIRYVDIYARNNNYAIVGVYFKFALCFARAYLDRLLAAINNVFIILKISSTKQTKGVKDINMASILLNGAKCNSVAAFCRPCKTPEAGMNA
jgi:glycosyltransferase involved in cell wall biosynthesis